MTWLLNIIDKVLGWLTDIHCPKCGSELYYTGHRYLWECPACHWDTDKDGKS